MKSVALILTQPPFANSQGHDALDLAMVLGSFEIPTAIFFVGPAVNLLRQVQPEIMAVKNYTKSFSALPFYDIDDLYACEEDLHHWRILNTELMDDLKIINKEEIQSKLANFDRVIRF